MVKSINVTKTFLPPHEEYQAILNKVWENSWLTNRGLLVQELEAKLQSYLQSPPLIAMTNGTLPLQIAIKALGLSGEIITTPFSYVATTSSIVWEGCTPVFVDIHPEYLTIDETKIEAAITSKTTGILATHVFGNPCAVEEIEIIAQKHNLKVIYDAAHCFGVTYKGNCIFDYGDVSTCSFHATKLFHTGEGGAFFCQDNGVRKAAFDFHNFGHAGPAVFSAVGINAKMSELQAAMGLAVFPYLEKILERREFLVKRYQDAFNALHIQSIRIRENCNWNYSYYPIILKSETDLLALVDELSKEQINPRRYFYPSLNTLNYVESKEMPISESISERVLCLPLYLELTECEQDKIIEIIKNKVS